MNAERFNQIRETVETTCRDLHDPNMACCLASVKSNGKYNETDVVFVMALAQITNDETIEFLDRLTGRAKRKVKQPKHFSPFSFLFLLF